MSENIYLSGEYNKINPTYHVEDSFYKWNNFKKLLLKSKINYRSFKNIVELGCGSGQILSQAKKSNFFDTNNFSGYDINPKAINLAKKLDNSINFYDKDFFQEKFNTKFDLIICSDVFEHIENNYEFLKKLIKKGNYFLFNIPLEISLLSLIRQNKVFSNSYSSVGHLHYYSKKTAMITLEHCKYNIISLNYAKNRISHFPKGSLTLKRMFVIIPQYLLDLINEDLSCAILGNYSLVVLAGSK